MAERTCGGVWREKRHRERSSRVPWHSQCIDFAKESLGVVGVNSLSDVEIMLSGEASQQVSSVILLQQFLVRAEVRNVDSVEGANNGGKALRCRCKGFSNPVRATHLLPTKGYLPKRSGVGDNMNGR